MIIDYDRRSDSTFEHKLKTLAESVQRALNVCADADKVNALEKRIKALESKSAWTRLGKADSTARTFKLDYSGTWELLTGNDTTASRNSLWVVRTAGDNAFLLSGTSTVTVTVSGKSVTVSTSSGSAEVFARFVG